MSHCWDTLCWSLGVACQEEQHGHSLQVARRVKVEQPPTELVTVKRVKGCNSDEASKVASGKPICKCTNSVS